MATQDVLMRKNHAVEAMKKEMEARNSVKRLKNFYVLTLQDEEALNEFLDFSRPEYAEDMILMWISIEKFKRLDRNDPNYRSAVVDIFLNYIKSRRIKLITAVQRKRIKKIITTPGKKVPSSLYDEIQKIVFDVIYDGIYARFLESPPGKKYVVILYIYIYIYIYTVYSLFILFFFFLRHTDKVLLYI
jgi:hypothetical protein